MRIQLILSLFILFHSLLLSAQELDKKPAFIFAAANLKFVFPQIIKEFYIKYPDARVYIQYASTGYLANSILKGKKYDIFFAANTQYPQQVYLAKKSITPPKIYTQGLLILFTPSNPLLSKKRLNILCSKEIKYISIANKSTAPYGAASIEVIKNIPCYKAAINKIKFTVDAATAIDNVIWNAYSGFLSKSALFMIPKQKKQKGVDWIEIDHKLYNPIMQAYVISKNGLKNDNAIKFLNFVESQAGQKIFKENGYKDK